MWVPIESIKEDGLFWDPRKSSTWKMFGIRKPPLSVLRIKTLQEFMNSFKSKKANTSLELLQPNSDVGAVFENATLKAI